MQRLPAACRSVSGVADRPPSCLPCPALPCARRALIPMHPDLKYAGMLPPLDAPHHLRSTEWGPFREGVVRRSAKGEGSWVDVGLDKDAHIPQASSSACCDCCACLPASLPACQAAGAGAAAAAVAPTQACVVCYHACRRCGRGCV